MKTSHLSKISLLIIAVFTLLSIAMSPAQAIESDTAINLDQSVSASDLDVSVPGNFYWLKQAWRGVQKAFTFDPIKKADLDLTEASEQLLQAQQLANKSNDTAVQARLQNSLKNYEEKIANIAKQAARWQNVEENRKEQFLTKLNDRQIKQQKLLESLADKVPEQTLENIKQAQEQSLQSWSEAMDKMLSNREKIAATVQNALQAQSGSNFKILKNLTIISDVADKLPGETAEQLWQVRDRMMIDIKSQLTDQTVNTQLSEYFAQMQGDPISHLRVISALDQATDLSAETKANIIQIKNNIIERLGNDLTAKNGANVEQVLQALSSSDIANIDLIEELKNKLPTAVKAQLGDGLENIQIHNLERIRNELQSNDQDTASYRMRLETKVQNNTQIKNMLQASQDQSKALPTTNRSNDDAFSSSSTTDNNTNTMNDNTGETDLNDDSEEEADDDMTTGQYREGMNEDGSSRK